MSAIVEPVIDYLRQLARQGQTHVHMDERAKLILREFYRRARGLDQPAAKGREVSAEVSNRPAPKKAALAAAVQSPSVTAVEAAAPVVVEKLMGTLEGLKKQMLADKAVQGLGSLRTKMVFSEGKIGAEVMVVGEVPSYYDEKAGAPFSGPAGKKMEDILKAMGISRDQVYLTNAVKFRPAMKNQTTNTRRPSAAEVQVSLRYLQAEIELVKPKVIIVLGAQAARALLSDKIPVEEMLGQFHKYKGIPVRASYHPSYLLHPGVTEEKRKVWRDMLAVMDLLKMPISDRQRGFFQKK